MIVVRNTFSAKPGHAGQLASQLKEAAVVAEIPNARVLTDITGDFNCVVLEYEAADIAEFQTRMQEYAKGGAFKEKMKGYTDLWLTGKREIFQIV